MPHYQTRMCSNGQLMISAAVREHFNLKPGDIVDFYIDDADRSVRILARNKSISDRREGFDLPARGRPVTLAEMDEAIGERLAEKDGRISRRSFFEGLDGLKLPSIGRPVTRADIDAVIDEEIDARRRRSATRWGRP
jgi:bifunctional DNA-binding transcriptional regulator/antitoxin component of YhaV-PrlF toxin-antitoxin module